MKPISGKELAKIVERKGWNLVKVSGSHHRYAKSGIRLTIPIHGNKQLKAGTQAALMKQAGLTEKDL
ncbi:MAG TPA: type II toxin-antitoxin system HicA family toxin [Fimbriimonadaceae bacterium]|nr:type II toxin-antitoxin system HicA family toxin [Fimbriimonadaceae bacterium]